MAKTSDAVCESLDSLSLLLDTPCAMTSTYANPMCSVCGTPTNVCDDESNVSHKGNEP